MISFLKTWANQIIVAVIIATIIEMILPNGNNKKYIKMMIGLYVLFTIIQPIITKFTGTSIDISNFNYKKYFNEDIIETSTEDFENNNSKLIKQAYIDNIKEDIKIKIEQKGFDVISCSIDILDDENEETYGTIQNINLKVNKLEKKIEKTSNTIEIEDIDISNNNTSVTEQSKLSNNEKKEIIEYLAEEYSVEKTRININ